ncbi:MAG TPA: hypothetical protein VGO93_18855 [Candidatus Xenobia bacterium]|jgi:hypothetical protein
MLSNDEVDRLLKMPWGAEPDMPAELVGTVMAAVQRAPRPMRWESWAAAALFVAAVLGGLYWVPIDFNAAWSWVPVLTMGWSFPEVDLAGSMADSQVLLALGVTVGGLLYLNVTAARRMQA